MTDWLAELEDKNKEAEDRVRDSQRSKFWYWRLYWKLTRYQPKKSVLDELVERYTKSPDSMTKGQQKTIETLFKRITDYVGRVKQLTKVDLSIVREPLFLSVSGPKERGVTQQRRIEFQAREEEFEVRVYTVRYRHDGYGSYDKNEQTRFTFPYEKFSNEYLSSWVKWVATGEGEILQ